MPVVSLRPTSSAPASAQATARRITSSSATWPCKVQPNAVDIPTSTSVPGAISSRRRATWRTTSTISAGVLRTLANEWAWLADTGKVSLWTPAASAARAPCRLGTSAITVRPGCVSAWRTTSAASAIWGISLGGTKEHTSSSRSPAATSASSQRSLSAVGMVARTDCRPSRMPTSLMSTAGGAMGG